MEYEIVEIDLTGEQLGKLQKVMERHGFQTIAEALKYVVREFIKVAE